MKVFEKMMIGKTQINNRIGVPPMCTYLCDTMDGVANDFHLAHYTTLAKGQPGFIIQEATAVNKYGHITDKCLGIYTPRQREALKRIVEQVHKCGVKIGIQLNHAGMKNTFGNEKYSAMSHDDVIALKEEQILEIIKDFEFACIWARDLGYDFVEIHAAHGYLINQFLSPLTNQRSDAYGDRTKLLYDLVDASLRSYEGDVIVRISAEEYEAGGLHPNDFIEITQKLEAMGVAAISVSSGGLNTSRIKSYPMYQIPYAKTIHDALTIPVMGVGLITREQEIESILNNDECDIVLLGRKLERDPYFLLKWRDTLGELTMDDVGECLYRSIHV